MAQRKEMVEKRSPRGLVPTSTYGRLDTEYNAFLTDLDPTGDSERGRTLRHALALSTNKRFHAFLERIGDPAYKRYSLAAIAKQLELSLPDFAEFWRKAQNMRALAIAAEASVEIVGDMRSDARTKMVSCDRCDGWGVVKAFDVPDPKREGLETVDPDNPDAGQIRACPVCKGEGKVPKVGDLESRKLILDMSGHTSKSKGVSVNVNTVNHFGEAGMESAVERLNRVTFDAEPISAETIDIPEESE